MTTDDEHRADVQALIAQVLGADPSEITSHTGLNRHPDWDSFAHVKIIHAIELTFGFDVVEDDILRTEDVAGIAQLVDDRIRKDT